MSEYALMVTQTIVFILTLFFAYAQYKKSRKDKIKRIEDKLIPVMQRDMGGVYIPGMSEKAGDQLKAKVHRILQEELG